jgi:hypothetical protein
VTGRLSVLVVFALGAFASPARADAVVKVACVGPQHVHSHQLDRRAEYPAMLQAKLGAGYQVGNFGDCCATVSRGYPRQRETHPYLEGGESYGEPMNFKDSIAFKPNVVVIGPWGKHDREIAMMLYGGKLDPVKFEADYDALVTTYLNQPTKPRVILLTTIPIPFGMAGNLVTDVMLPAIKNVAARYKLPLVDLHTPFLNKRELFKDDTHVTNGAGLALITEAVHTAIKASDGTADAGAVEDAGVATDTAVADGSAGSGGSGGAGGTGSGGAGGSGSGSGGAGGSAGAGTSGGGSGGAGGSAGSGGNAGSAGGAGPRPGTDAATNPTPTGSGSSPACGCRLGRPSPAPAALILLMVGLVLIVAR